MCHPFHYQCTPHVLLTESKAKVLGTTSHMVYRMQKLNCHHSITQECCRSRPQVRTVLADCCQYYVARRPRIVRCGPHSSVAAMPLSVIASVKSEALSIPPQTRGHSVATMKCDTLPSGHPAVLQHPKGCCLSCIRTRMCMLQVGNDVAAHAGKPSPTQPPH